MTYTCSDKELYNNYNKPAQGLSFLWRGKKSTDEEIECKQSAMEKVICAMQGGVHNIYKLGTCGKDNEINVNGVLDFIGDVLSGENKKQNEQITATCNKLLKKPPSIVELLDCYCLESQSRKLLKDSACVVGKFPLLYLSLEEETEKHNRLIKERDRLRKKIEKLKKLNK